MFEEDRAAPDPAARAEDQDAPEPAVGLPDRAGVAPSAPGAIADGSERQLDPASVRVARLTGYVLLGGVCIPGPIAVASMVAFADFPGVVDAILVGALVCLIVAVAAAAHWWPPVRYRHMRYRVDEGGLTIWQGVLWRTVTSVPKLRVQHTDVSQGPLQRRYGLGTLTVHTAGTQDASVSLSGLAHETALRIRDFLVDARSTPA